MSSLPLIALSPCTIIRASGTDALRFLNGQLTNELNLATELQSIQAAALDAKGGLIAICWIRKSEDDYLIDAPLSLREELMDRLDRYLIADDVTLTDESDDWKLVHLLSETASSLSENNCIVTQANRFSCPGIDILSRERPQITGAEHLSQEQSEALRIERGIPAWDHELTTGILPPEAGLDETAISYNKGCYLGQEIISRMKRAQKKNRHLVQLEIDSGISPGTEFSHEDTRAGVITSITRRPDQNTDLALGFRSRKFEAQDNFSVAGANNDGTATVVRVVKKLA